jgi:hypothetical protein
LQLPLGNLEEILLDGTRVSPERMAAFRKVIPGVSFTGSKNAPEPINQPDPLKIEQPASSAEPARPSPDASGIH